MARKQVELTIHQPGQKTVVDEAELPNLRTQGPPPYGLIRAGDDGDELVEDVPESAPGKAAEPKPPTPTVPAAKPAAAKDGS